MDQQFDVLVIGAGAAGLLAALEIALTGKKVAIIEAKEKAGGRILTQWNESGYPVESGAEFVHGDLPITQQLLKKAGVKSYEIEGAIWQKKNGELSEQEDFIEDFSKLEKKFEELERDLSVADFIKNYLPGEEYEELRFTLQNYVEGYYAADINKASTQALATELTTADDEQYRIEKGYQPLVDYMEQQCREKGVQFFFSHPVNHLHWKKGEVEAVTEKGSFKGKKGLITVSIGVLQQESIRFYPALPEKTDAAKHLGFGHVVKINFQFEDAFWLNKEYTNGKNLEELNFLFSEEDIPTWWTQHPREDKIITGWLGGPKAKALNLLDHKAIIQKGLASLSRIFSIDVIHLHQKLTASWFHNWSADTFVNGAYSYAVVDGEKYMQQILEPVENTIFFAGEGLYAGNEIGTVEAALQSGRNVSHQLVASF